MEEDNSNDVVLIENTQDENSKTSVFGSETRPLMLLFDRLISNDCKSNTVLTNAQILSILEKEFNMTISDLHELEIDIYINVIKKFLKDWPLWDSFDRVINKLKKKEALPEIKHIIEQKYKHLKEYLQSMIDTAKPLAQAKCSQLLAEQAAKQSETCADTVLEIYCTRKMLNNFIYEQPNVAQNNTIFNLPSYEPYKCNPDKPVYSLATILYWYGVRLSIELPFFQYSRYTTHQLTHELVNEANGKRQFKELMDTSIYKKSMVTKSLTHAILTDSIKEQLNRILKQYKNQIEYNMLSDVFEVIKEDLLIDSTTIEIPGTYKKRLSKYPYIRKLNSKVQGSQPSNMKLYLEETVTPTQNFHLGKFVSILQPALPSLQSWLKLECGDCKQRFNGSEFLTLMRLHFEVYHVDEPDWSCSNCNKTFVMHELAHQGWRHDCSESESTT